MGNLSKRQDIVAVVIIFVLAIFLEYTEGFSLLEDETLSYRQILRTHYASPEYTSPIDDVVIVYTDEGFYEDYDKYPLRRVDLSTLIVRLKAMGAAVIGVDILLDFNSAYGEDPTLEDALQEAGNVLLVSQAEFDADSFFAINTAIPRFARFTESGYSNISSNSAISESIVRLHIYPEIVERWEAWPFAVKAVSMFTGEAPTLDAGALRFGDSLAIGLDQFNELYIDYPLLPAGPEGTQRLHEVVGISASDLLFVEDEEELNDLSFLVSGKIVLIGEVAEVAHDEFETPVGNVYGVSIIASTIATMLRGGPLQAASFITEALCMLLLMACLLSTRLLQNPLPRNLVSLAVISGYVLIVVIAYIYFGVVLALSYALIASLLAMIIINGRFYLNEMGQKALIRDAFGQYLSPKVVADLEKDPGKLALGGEERVMTTFFSDIAGFSSFSEQMTPGELVLVLNEYLTEMCDIIIGYEGTVDKFEGDAIMAFWGAPSVQEDHARLACFAAIDMASAITGLRNKWVGEGRPAIAVRMGVNSGPMVVGNMGSTQKYNYTVMGDAVNLASRLEGANKAYASGTMISEATYSACRDDVDVRELDLIRVVGKEEAVRVYQLLARKNQAEGPMQSLVPCYESALADYRQKNFADALRQFESCLQWVPDDGPSKVFIARCQRYLETPPVGDWDGVFNLEEKG